MKITFKTFFILIVSLIMIGMINISYAEELNNEAINNDLNVENEIIKEDENIEEKVENEEKNILLNENNTIYYEDVVNTGRDTGFSKINNIENGDPHYGWKLGKFAISGFSGKRKDEDGNWVLLKNAGDEIKLYFNLQQDINKLDGNDKLKIEIDKNGYDNEFGIKETNFGQGCLIIRKIDPTENKNDPEIYTDYLKGVSVGANTEVKVFEEGNYEVALDYEIVKESKVLLKSFNNYRIKFKFSVRNGNCMVFPYDVATGQELSNTSMTENGFYLDLARSQYLDIIIKKEVLKEGTDGLVEDTRFNRPAKDGEKFTEEGIYTITVKNQYTQETTTKKIYVGKDKVLKAHVQTGRSIENIRTLVNAGATIDEEGNISDIPEVLKENHQEQEVIKDDNKNISVVPISIIFIIIVFIIVNIIKAIKEKKLTERIKEKANNDNDKYYRINNKYILHIFIENNNFKYDLLDDKLEIIDSNSIKDYESENIDELKDKVLNELKIEETVNTVEEISKDEFEKNRK